MKRKKKVSELRVGDFANDWDFKFQAGTVVAVGDGWFEIEWVRGGVIYTKRHEAADLENGRLVAW